MPELGGARPDRLVDVRPQARLGRHGGIGYELVLSTAVPQALEEEVVAPGFMRGMLEDEAEEKDQRKAGNRMKRKARKRRKKKTPKTHSSSSLLHRGSSRGGAGDQGIMHEYEFEDAERAGVPPNIQTVHAEPLNSVHCKEVTGYWDEMKKLIEDKVIIGNTGEEIILKNGQPAFSLYSDRTHLQTCPWLDWMKIVIDTYGDWGIYRGGQVYCLHLHAAKTVMKRGLSKRCLVRRLTRR